MTGVAINTNLIASFAKQAINGLLIAAVASLPRDDEGGYV